MPEMTTDRKRKMAASNTVVRLKAREICDLLTGIEILFYYLKKDR